jgi:hypothetical protein
MHPTDEFDFNQKPFLVIWETTRACDLACLHCRASAQPYPEPDELTTEQGKSLLTQIRDLGAPLVVLSGGDVLKRPDIFELIEEGKRLRLRVAAIPAVTRFLKDLKTPAWIHSHSAWMMRTRMCTTSFVGRPVFSNVHWKRFVPRGNQDWEFKLTRLLIFIIMIVWML